MQLSVHVDALHPMSKISKNIYGQFSEHLGRCIYQGLFVGKDSPIPNVNGMRTDVVNALKEAKVPLLRWPGGCFADEYHWRDGIGPQAQRKRMVNTNWGYVVEDNSFGTHEFLELCRQIGCEPYINANVGSGTVREMAEWVEYLNSEGDSSVVQERWANGRKEPFNVKYWGVGNESWGCGGNMEADFYADVYRRFQTYCRDYGDNKLYRIACGPNTDNWEWTETLMKKAAKYMDGLTLHYYDVPSGKWKDKGSATEFTEERYYETLVRAAYMETLLRGHLAIMDRYDENHRVKLLVDEWGCWHDVEPGTNPGFLYQQNTMRDAMVAAITLNIFNAHADRLGLCCIAQMVNVLQAMILTEGDQMVLTPTYHVFNMYKDHQDAELLESCVFSGNVAEALKQISASASIRDGSVTVTMANLHATEKADVLVNVEGMEKAAVTGTVLAGAMDALNTFQHPDTVKPVTLEGIVRTERGLVVPMPACSVVTLKFNA